MNNNLLLSLATSVIPILALIFVGFLVLYKIYWRIRSKFNVQVNCWFCNQNAKVPFVEFNSWTCAHCEQYNGFTKDGDYNREIFQQLDCSQSSSASRYNYSDQSSSERFGSRTSLPPRNGFCNVCNEAQRLKVEKLAQFEPKNESHFNEELKAYKAQLEEQYRLCATCDRHLNKVLREKKKMVLGSKFLDFIIKGAETLKKPHFNQIRHVYQQQWKRRLTLHITLLTLINLCCLFGTLPTLTRDKLTTIFGDTIGPLLFIALSHVTALSRVMASYLDGIGQHDTVLKIGLFFRTLTMMVLYSMGLKLPQIVRFNFVSLYVLVCPFAILGLAFGHNILDHFKLSRYTFLLVLWSAFAGGLVGDQWLLSENILMFMTSLVTLLLSVTSKAETSTKLHDSSANSFHKIYSEDYLSDEETMSILSEQLDCSASSVRSSGTTNHRSYRAPSPQQRRSPGHARFTKSPITSSVLSLNNMPRPNQFSPNSSFKSFCTDDQQSTFRSQYAGASTTNFAMPQRSSMFASNVELSSRERPLTSVFGLSANIGPANGNASFANSSFCESQAYRQNNEDLFTNAAGPRASNFSVAAAPMLSPFSASSNAVYQQRRSNLVSPTRFSTNCLASNASSTTSWLSGGYFNQRQAGHHQQCPDTTSRSNLLYEHRNGMTAIEENLSRASSQSSGFESQNGRLNLSRENSFCPDSVDLQQRTVSLDHAKAFQPIEPNGSAFSPRPSLLLTAMHTQPLSVDCSVAATSYASPSASLWKAPAVRRNISGRDSFNLRKITEELPALKRGDLLKKWQQNQGQTIS